MYRRKEVGRSPSLAPFGLLKSIETCQVNSEDLPCPSIPCFQGHRLTTIPRSYGILAYWGPKRGVCFYHDDHCKDPAIGMWATEEWTSCLTGKTAKGPWRSIRMVDSTTACKMVTYNE